MQLPPDPDYQAIDDTGLTALFLEIIQNTCPQEPAERIRWLKGQHYQAAVRIMRLRNAWPEPNAAQIQSLIHANIWYATVVSVLNEALTG